MDMPKKTLINAAVSLFHRKEQEATDHAYHTLCLRQTPPHECRGQRPHEVWHWALRRWRQTWIETERQVRNEKFPPLAAQGGKPPTKWRSILDLPEKIGTQPCVVVWQDSEHPSDQGVQVTTVEEIAGGHFNTDRIVDAYWSSLSDPFSLASDPDWTTIKTIPLGPGNIGADDAWEIRGVVASKQAENTHFMETNLYQVKDGDFKPSDRWMSIMDAPAMTKL